MSGKRKSPAATGQGTEGKEQASFALMLYDTKPDEELQIEQLKLKAADLSYQLFETLFDLAIAHIDGPDSLFNGYFGRAVDMLHLEDELREAGR